MARHVHLVRHGEVHNPEHLVYASLPGFDLSDRGTRQSRELARYLRSAPIVAIWSSPLQRALSTAAPLARALGLPIQIDDDLVEWKMADGWAGVAWDDLPTERPGELEAYLEHPLDLPFASESLTALAERMRRATIRLADRHDAGDVVIVSHQDPVQAARLALTGRDLAGQHTNKPGHASVATVRPGTPWNEVTRWEPGEVVAFPPDATSAESDPEQLGIGVEGELG